MKIETTSDPNTILINGIPEPAVLVAKGHKNGKISLVCMLDGRTAYCYTSIKLMSIDGVSQAGKTIEEVVVELNTFLGLGFKRGGSSGTGGGVSPDPRTIMHSLLLGRNAANAHPIGAITGLQDYIDGYISIENTTPNSDITRLWMPKKT